MKYDAHQHEHEKRDFDRAIPPRAADDLARCGSVITTDPALNPPVVMPRPQVASHFFSTVVLDECHRSRDRYADPQPSCAAGGNSASLAIKDIFLTESRIIVTPLRHRARPRRKDGAGHAHTPETAQKNKKHVRTNDGPVEDSVSELSSKDPWYRGVVP